MKTIKCNLDEKAVEEISNDLQIFLNQLNMECRNILRIRLTVEELLLNIIEGCGKGLAVSVSFGKYWGRQVLRIYYQGGLFDPTTPGELSLSGEMLRSLGLSPVWTYRGQRNMISMVLMDRPKRSTVFYILFSLVLSVLLGVAGLGLPETIRQNLQDMLLEPVGNGFLGLMNTFSGMMIFFSICTGILGLGDQSSLSRIGRSVLLRIAYISLAVCVATFVLIQPFIHMRFAFLAEQGNSQMDEISKMIFGILPSDPIEPFRTGNIMQIIVISLFIGIAFLSIGERGSHARIVAGEINSLLQQTVSFVSALVPIFVFTTILQQIWSQNIGAFLSIWKPVILMITFEYLLAAFFLLVSSARLKCHPVLILKKVLPVYLTAFTTASSLSAMTLGMETCEKKLGIKKSIVSFIYPLGSVIYRPGSIVYYLILVCSLSEIYQIEISVAWIVTALVISVLIAVALPPIAGAGILGYAVLLGSLEIPSEAIVLATATDLVIDFFDTSCNVLLLMFHSACEADRLEALDQTVLREKKL